MNSPADRLTYAQRAALGDTAGDRARAGQGLALHDSVPADRRPRIQDAQDALNLLAYIAAFDSRVRGDFEAQAWFDALGPHQVAITDAKRAVVSYFNGPRRHQWITPGDIVEILEEGL